MSVNIFTSCVVLETCFCMYRKSLNGSRQVKNYLRTCVKCIDSDSSRACAKSHPSICSPFVHSIVSNDFVSFCKRTVKGLIRLRKCAGWSGPSLCADTRGHVFAAKYVLLYIVAFQFYISILTSVFKPSDTTYKLYIFFSHLVCHSRTCETKTGPFLST